LNPERKALVKYRYEKSQNTFNVAETLFNADQYSHAVNRYYYAVFYAIRALLATVELESRKHSGTIALFNKRFVKTGLFAKKYSEVVRYCFEERSDADYEDFRVFEKQEVEDLSADVASFLQAVGEYLAKTQWID